ncbi:MAG: peptidylprolyl isomerase [Bacteroidales bacterium]
MKKVFLFLVCVSVSVSYCFSQFSSFPDSVLDDTVMIVGDTTHVSVQEFLWFNQKYNAYADENIRLSLIEYADLFANYKRKVLEAKRLQYDTTADFQDEYSSYIRKTANSHIFKDAYTEDLIKLEYDRLHTDYEVQHIFIKVSEFAAPEDTLDAYTEAQNIISQVRAGKDFGELAKTYSDDSFSKDHGGYLGYITSLLMPLEYENALYDAEIGEILGPVRAKHGYFVIKVLDKRKSKGERRASLIVLYPDDKDSQASWDSIQKEAENIYSQIQNGADFDSLAVVKNKNQRLRNAKGDIGWFDNTVKYHTLLKEHIFAIENVHECAKPLKLSYGYVIPCLTDKDSLADYQSYKQDVEPIIKKDESRKNWKHDYAIQQLKKKHSYSIFYDNFNEFIDVVQKSILVNKWEKPDFEKNKKILQVNNTVYRYNDFADFLYKHQKASRISGKDNLVRYRFNQFLEKKLTHHEYKNIMQDDSLQMLAQEYYEGMLMFELMQKQVYKKATSDSVGLLEFYTSHISEYMKPPSVSVTMFTLDKPKHAKRLKRFLSKRPEKYSNDSILVQKVSNRWVDLDYSQHDYFKGDSEYIDSLDWRQGLVFQKDSVTYGYIQTVENSKPEEFNSIKTQLISDYQVWLEKQLMKRLEENYAVEIKQDVIDTVSEYLH